MGKPTGAFEVAKPSKANTDVFLSVFQDTIMADAEVTVQIFVDMKPLVHRTAKVAIATELVPITVQTFAEALANRPKGVNNYPRIIHLNRNYFLINSTE